MGKLAGRRIGWALAASHCSFEEVLPHIERLRSEGAEVYPILSEHATDTRFGTVEEWVARLEQATGRRVMRSILETEPLGPQKLLDALVIAPCTGNTLAKLALAITDSAVLMVHFLCDAFSPCLRGAAGSGRLFRVLFSLTFGRLGEVLRVRVEDLSPRSAPPEEPARAESWPPTGATWRTC